MITVSEAAKKLNVNRHLIEKLFDQKILKGIVSIKEVKVRMIDELTLEDAAVYIRVKPGSGRKPKSLIDDSGKALNTDTKQSYPLSK